MIISPKHNPHHFCYIPTGPAVSPGARGKKRSKNAQAAAANSDSKGNFSLKVKKSEKQRDSS